MRNLRILIVDVCTNSVTPVSFAHFVRCSNLQQRVTPKIKRSKSFPNESEATDHAAELEDLISSRSGTFSIFSKLCINKICKSKIQIDCNEIVANLRYLHDNIFFAIYLMIGVFIYKKIKELSHLERVKITVTFGNFF